jgi:energy-coupling factor transporter ATP-binding protein EcfA2
MIWIEKELAKHKITKRDMKKLVRRAGADLVKTRQKLEEIDKYFGNGNTYLEDEDRDDFENFLSIQLIARYQSDPLTNVGAGAPGEYGFRHWWIQSLGIDVLVYWIQPGRFALVLGEPGSGKTDFLMKLMELARRRYGRKVCCITNVKLKESVEGIVYVVTLSDMYLEAIKARREGYEMIFFGFDEGLVHGSSVKTGGIDVTEIENMIFLNRKFGNAMGFLGQYFERMPTILRDYCHVFLEKIDYETVFVDVNLPKRPDKPGLEFEETITGVPPTELPFDTEAQAMFRMDFKVKDALDYLALLEKESADTQIDRFEQYLLYQQQKITLETMPEEYKKYFAWKMYTENKGKKVNLQIIGKTFGKGTTTIHNWVQEIDARMKKRLPDQ